MKTNSEKSEKNENSKIFGYIGLAIGAITLGLLGYHMYKSSKRIKKQEKQAKQDIEELGVSPEKLEKEVKYHERDNFVKTLYVSTAFKSDAVVDDDVLDTEDAFDSSNVVHVFQKRRGDIWTGGNFKDCYNRNFLEFLIELPDYIAEKEEKGCRLHISDYIKCLKAAANHMRDQYGKFSPFPERELVGWLKIKYDNPNYDPDDEFSYKELDGFVELPKWVYRSYEDERGHGVTKLFANVTGRDTFGEAEENVGKLLDELYPGRNPKVEHMGLAYRIVFPIRDEANWQGLTLKDALSCIQYLCTEFEVTKNPDTGREIDRVDFDHIIFHAPNSRGKWSWRKFYDIAEDNSVIVVDYNDR